MAKGYPDFYGMQTFPKHGPVTDSTVDPLVVASDGDVTIHNIAGKGVIKGGFLRCGGELDGWSTDFILTVDGSTITAITGLQLWGAEVFSADCGAFYLVDYNDPLRVIGLAFSPGITFDSQFLFQIHHREGANRNIYSTLYYTRIL